MQVTLLHNDQQHTLAAREVDGSVWISSSGLGEVTGFEFKPEGACYGEVCIPLPPVAGKPIAQDGELNLAAVAQKLGQALVHDEASNVISLGAIPEVRQRFAEGKAPDFDLVDRLGEPVSLAKFPNQKVILMTWASW